MGNLISGDDIREINYTDIDGPHGQGKVTHSTGEVREGQWINGQFTGTGSYRNKNNAIYERELKNIKIISTIVVMVILILSFLMC
jgi:hypothetical protein